MKIILLAGLLLLSSGLAQACKFAEVTFNSDFELAKLDGCTQLSDNSYLLVTKPENRPINHSPWYAFKVSSKTSKEIEINIQFDNERPRYLPKISNNGIEWSQLDFTLLGGVMTFDIDVTSAEVWIAGQELISNEAYQEWIKKLAKSSSSQSFLLGNSTQGRPINALISKPSKNKEWLVLLGRQHPPEVTGALAMIPFVEKMLSSDPLAEKFRQRFNLFIVPNLNPDGVSNGYWRHNINGIDLNRDWIKFSQIETSIVRDKLNEIVEQGGKMVMAVDFHSTQQDVFYTMPSDYGMVPSDLVVNWLDKIKRNTVSSFVVRNKPGTSPGRGVFKQYFTDTFKVHAITYEMGDNTERKMIQHVANQAANTLMQTLLETEPSAFYPPQKAH